jgi:hypothetical protein
VLPDGSAALGYQVTLQAGSPAARWTATVSGYAGVAPIVRDFVLPAPPTLGATYRLRCTCAGASIACTLAVTNATAAAGWGTGWLPVAAFTLDDAGGVSSGGSGLHAEGGTVAFIAWDVTDASCARTLACDATERQRCDYTTALGATVTQLCTPSGQFSAATTELPTLDWPVVAVPGTVRVPATVYDFAPNATAAAGVLAWRLADSADGRFSVTCSGQLQLREPPLVTESFAWQAFAARAQQVGVGSTEWPLLVGARPSFVPFLVISPRVRLNVSAANLSTIGAAVGPVVGVGASSCAAVGCRIAAGDSDGCWGVGAGGALVVARACAGAQPLFRLVVAVAAAEGGSGAEYGLVEVRVALAAAQPPLPGQRRQRRMPEATAPLAPPALVAANAGDASITATWAPNPASIGVAAYVVTARVQHPFPQFPAPTLDELPGSGDGFECESVDAAGATLNL